MTGRLTLMVRDDGVGGADPGAGTGLIGLQDRVEAIGGTITIDSSSGDGTCVVVRLPITVELDQGIGTSSPIARGGVTQESGLKAKQCPRLVCLADANSPSRVGAAPADLRQRARSRPPSNAGSSATTGEMGHTEAWP